MIMALIGILIPSLVLMTPLFLGWLILNRANAHWRPRATGRTASIRHFETGLTLLGLVFFACVWLYQGDYRTLTPQRFVQAESSPVIQSYYRWAMGVGSVISLVVTVLVWRVNTGLTLLALLLSLMSGSMLLQQAVSERTQFEWKLQYAPGLLEQDESKKEPSPVRLRFELNSQLAGADLWMNGVLLGQVPFEITDQELFRRVPKLTQQQINTLRQTGKPEDNYVTPRGDRLSAWGWCPIHFLPSGDRATDLYFRTEFQGKRLYSSIGQQHTRRDPDRVEVILLDSILPEWDTAIETLLDQARIADYAVDAAWFETFDSYGRHAELRLEQALAKEPGLAKLRQQRVRLQYALDEVRDSASAWERLLQISAEARQKGEYESRSTAGLAVDLIVPLLDVDQLLDYAIKLAPRCAMADRRTIRHSPDGFGTVPDSPSEFGEQVEIFPFAQAIWRIDQKLDAERRATESQDFVLSSQQRMLQDFVDPQRDHVIERTLTPFLMRVSYFERNRLNLVSIIGGSSYENFLVRNDWRGSPDPFMGRRTVGEITNQVNEWFYQLIWLPSPLGREFRRVYTSEIVSVIERGIPDFAFISGSLSNDFDFVFLDPPRSGDEQSLLMRVWRSVDRRADAAPAHAAQQTLTLRWKFLARMWPASTPEMFFTAFEKARKQSEYLYVQSLPDPLSADAKFQIYQYVIDQETARAAKLPGDPMQGNGPRAKAEELIRQVRNQQIWQPCQSAAEKLVTLLESNPKDELWSSVAIPLKYDLEHDDMVARLAASENSNVQMLALPAIESHPTKIRRKILDRLLQSPHDAVQQAARKVQVSIETLQRQKVGKRIPPLAI